MAGKISLRGEIKVSFFHEGSGGGAVAREGRGAEVGKWAEPRKKAQVKPTPGLNFAQKLPAGGGGGPVSVSGTGRAGAPGRDGLKEEEAGQTR